MSAAQSQPRNTLPNEPLLDSTAMAETLGVSIGTFRKLKLPHVMVGWRRRFIASQVLAHLAANPPSLPAEMDSAGSSLSPQGCSDAPRSAWPARR